MAVGTYYSNAATVYYPNSDQNGRVWVNWVQGSSTTSLTTASSTCTPTLSVDDLVWYNWSSNSSLTLTMTDYDSGSDSTYRIWVQDTIRIDDQIGLIVTQPEAIKVVNDEMENSIKRAEKLLLSHLTPEQKAQLEKESKFEVESQSGKKFMIEKGRYGNVYSLDKARKKVDRFCIHPQDMTPDYDTMLAQLIWLKWNEAEFMRTANISKAA